MRLAFRNSLSGAKEPFVPADPAHVTLYVCGPTVYNYSHVGNARPAVVFDTLYRLLRRHYPRVTYVRNFTDVDDKINAAAAEAEVPIGAITERFIAAYQRDMAALGVQTPDLQPRVTEHVPDIIDMVQRLITRGHAYVAQGHVLFSVLSFPAYGKLSGRSLDDMLAGARVDVAPYKRHAADFVLWKPSTDELPGWESPWGRGRPGWHIECSAMIAHHLGPSIDIHGGGQDLIFPHHENEIAQGTCAHDGALYARMWLHNGMVTVDGAKMAKSVGNVRLVRDLLARWSGDAIRLVLLSAHYRQPVDFSDAALDQAERTLARVRAAAISHFPDAADPDRVALHVAEVEAAMADDLNTPKALAVLAQLARSVRRAGTGSADAAVFSEALRQGAGFLGMLEQAAVSVAPERSASAIEAEEIESLLTARANARARRDFGEADRIRDRLASLGLALQDAPAGLRQKVQA